MDSKNLTVRSDLGLCMEGDIWGIVNAPRTDSWSDDHSSGLYVFLVTRVCEWLVARDGFDSVSVTKWIFIWTRVTSVLCGTTTWRGIAMNEVEEANSSLGLSF